MNGLAFSSRQADHCFKPVTAIYNKIHSKATAAKERELDGLVPSVIRPSLDTVTRGGNSNQHRDYLGPAGGSVRGEERVSSRNSAVVGGGERLPVLLP